MRAVVFRPSRSRLAASLVYNRVTGRPAVFRGGVVDLIECPEPTLPGERWVKVRSRVGGICGSDLKSMRLKFSTKSASLARRGAGEPIRFQGHETMGEVIEAGNAVTRFKPGDRVVMIPGVHCAALERSPACRHCREGAYSLCTYRDEVLHDQPVGGGWSEVFVQHESQLHPVPEGISDEDAALFDPLACSLHCVLRHPPLDGDKVLVLGAGTIGLGIVTMLRALGRDLDITVMARHAFQAEIAMRYGADRVTGVTPGDAYAELASAIGDQVIGHRRYNRLLREGFDVVFDAVGSAGTLHTAMRVVRPGGTVVFEGVDLAPGVLDRTPLWYREINIVGANGHGRDELDGHSMSTFDRLTGLMSKGKVRTDGMKSHSFRLDQYPEAIRCAAMKTEHESVKVVFDFHA